MFISSTPDCRCKNKRYGRSNKTGSEKFRLKLNGITQQRRRFSPLSTFFFIKKEPWKTHAKPLTRATPAVPRARFAGRILSLCSRSAFYPRCRGTSSTQGQRCRGTARWAGRCQASQRGCCRRLSGTNSVFLLAVRE